MLISLAHGQEPLEVLELVGLAHVAEELARFVATDRLAAEGMILGDDLAHLLFDGAKVVVVELPRGAVVVVVEAVVGRGTEGHLGAGEEPLDRVGHHVTRRVSDDGQGVRMVGPDGLDLLRALGNGRHQVEHLPVDARGDDIGAKLAVRFEGLAGRRHEGQPGAQSSVGPLRRSCDSAPLRGAASPRRLRGPTPLVGLVGTGGIEPPTPTVSM